MNKKNRKKGARTLGWTLGHWEGHWDGLTPQGKGKESDGKYFETRFGLWPLKIVWSKSCFSVPLTALSPSTLLYYQQN